jgi:hypothetical protein
MIWYELSKGKLQIPDENEYTLVCTHLSLMELAFTRNVYKNIQDVQKVIKCIMDIKPIFIMHIPDDYILTLIDEKYDFKYDLEDDLIMGFLKMINNYKEKELIEGEFKEHFDSIAERRKSSGKERTDYLNDFYKPFKEISYVFKKYPTTEIDKQFFRQKFIHEFNESNDTMYSENNFNWTNIEFYEKINIKYRRNLMITKMKAEPNDENDLRNMIYVLPNDKYWTLEKRWLAMAKEIKLTQYLFEPKF